MGVRRFEVDEEKSRGLFAKAHVEAAAMIRMLRRPIFPFI